MPKRTNTMDKKTQNGVKVKTIDKTIYYIVRYRMFSKDHVRSWWVTDREPRTGNLAKYDKVDDARRRAYVLSKIEKLPFGLEDTMVEEYSPNAAKSKWIGISKANKKYANELKRELYKKKSKFIKDGKAF